MSASEQINKIELQINLLRLELIKIITAINRMLSNIPKATRTAEYQALKAEYQLKQEEIYCLRVMKKDLSKGSLAA